MTLIPSHLVPGKKANKRVSQNVTVSLKQDHYTLLNILTSSTNDVHVKTIFTFAKYNLAKS